MWIVRSRQLLLALGIAGTMAACSLAPQYAKPATNSPSGAYKEAGDWKAAQARAEMQPARASYFPTITALAGARRAAI